MLVYLKHKNNAKIKAIPIGFSWTVFFFGLFVPLFRRDLKIILPFFLIYITMFYFMSYTYSDIDGMVSVQFSDNFGIYQIISGLLYFCVNILGAFFYNRLYAQSLVNKGFYPISPDMALIMESRHIKLPQEYDELNNQFDI